jgi:uncharacterized protein
MFGIMKMSKYNFTTYDHEGNLIVYNFLTGLPSLTKVMKPDVEKFTKLFLTNLEINNISCEGHAETVDSLLNSGILVAGDTNENVLYDSIHYDEAYDSKLNLFILPTGECNFNCAYCFESKKPFFRGTMTLDAQNAILKFVQKQIPNHRSLRVAWFGGEPLLKHQIIKYLSNKFIKICDDRFLPYSAEITTNGFYLDADMFDMLYNLKVYSYMITLDGFKEQHDKLRFTRNGMGSYDVIMANLLKIRDNKKYRFAHIRIRVNMTKSFMDILDDFLYFIDSSFSDDPRFSFQFEPVTNFSESNSSDDDLYANYHELFPNLLKNEVYANKLYPEKHKIYPIDAGQMCVAKLKNSYVIAPNLNVYKCYVHYDMEFNNVGSISLNGDLLLDETLHKRWYLINKFVQKIPEACNDCFYLPVCHNGNKACPVRYIKPKPNAEPCPMDNEEHKKTLTTTILYAAQKYPCTTLVI